MGLEYSVDLISDLRLERTDQFDWTGKPTSLFCVIAGNISSDPRKIKEVLEHLSTMYRGVFYIDGTLEHRNVFSYEENIEKLGKICRGINNVIYMHNHVVVLNSVAFVAVNGWYGYPFTGNMEENYKISSIQNEDLGYLSTTIKNLQLHKDATKIVIISNSIPSDHFLYNSNVIYTTAIEPGLSLVMDTDEKVTHWLYGGQHIRCDTTHGGRRFINNPKDSTGPYWPKRIVI